MANHFFFKHFCNFFAKMWWVMYSEMHILCYNNKKYYIFKTGVSTVFKFMVKLLPHLIVCSHISKLTFCWKSSPNSVELVYHFGHIYSNFKFPRYFENFLVIVMFLGIICLVSLDRLTANIFWRTSLRMVFGDIMR